METLRKYYIYALLDPRKPGKYSYGGHTFEYEPFYIGKGSGKRAYAHSFPSMNKNIHKKRKILKIAKTNIEHIVTIIENDLTEREALIKEKYLIDVIGRFETVVINLSKSKETC